MTTTTLTCTKQDITRIKGKPNPTNPTILTIIRACLLCALCFAYLHSDNIQAFIDAVWKWLRLQWWYQSVYNETFMVPLYSLPAIFPYRFMFGTGIAEKYRIGHVGGEYDLFSYKDLLMETVEYIWPLFILDTFHVKKYAGVSEEEIAAKRVQWIQTTRCLPEAPPLVGDMLRHLILALIIYDACFFLQHFIFHKNVTLFKLFHSKHHLHGSVNVKVTNKLHVVERILLVLSANVGLKIQGAHPLTRTVFIFVFLSILLDNHSGYDFPYSYEKILPRGLVGGAKNHFEHHEYGTKNYQPIFTYLDHLVDFLSKRKKTKSI